MEGARNILASFGSVGLKVALASNSPRALCEHALKSVGLIDYFDEITSAEQVSAGKPDPSVYLEAAKRIRVNPKRCIAFEDSLVGAQAACAAQMRVFVVPSRRQEIPEMNRLGISLITSLERFEFPAWRPGRY
jgi:HAD superfamily hydrolase (TIGR01509 family)